MTDFARISPQHDAEKTASMKLKHPYDMDVLNHDGKPISIDLIGVDSKAGRRAAAEMVKRLDKRGAKQRKASAMTVGEILAITDESEDVTADFLSALVKGWVGITYVDNPDDDKEVPRVLEFTRENAAMLFKNRKWIADQVNEFLGDKANFRRDMT